MKGFGDEIPKQDLKGGSPYRPHVRSAVTEFPRVRTGNARARTLSIHDALKKSLGLCPNAPVQGLSALPWDIPFGSPNIMYYTVKEKA